jgi:hypothetical protein
MAGENDATPVAAPKRPRGLIFCMNMFIGRIKNIFHVFIRLSLAISVSYEHYIIPPIQSMQFLAAPLAARSGLILCMDIVIRHIKNVFQVFIRLRLALRAQYLPLKMPCIPKQ